MNSYQTRVYTMLKEVVTFETAHRSAFPPGSNAAKRFDDNHAFIAKIEAQLEEQRESLENPTGNTTPSLNPLLKSAIANVRLLDAPVKNKFGDQPKVLKLWESSSSVEVDGGSNATPPAA